MKKLIQWTLFIDMLGYGSINGHIKDNDSAEDFYNFMKSNADIFTYQDRQEMKDIYKESEIFNLYDYYDIKVKFISDSIIISYNPIEQNKEIPERFYYLHSANTLIIILKRLQTLIYKCLKEKNIFLRGGVSNKFCYIKDDFAFGEGLIEAYKTESLIANFPRVCLSQSVIDNTELIKSFNFLCKMLYVSDSFIKEDEGIYFLDYLKHNIYDGYRNPQSVNVLAAFFHVHKDSITIKLNEIENIISNSKTDIEKNKSLKLKDKFLWLKNYHNSSLEKYIEEDYLIK